MAQDDATNHHVYTHPGPVEHWRHLVEIAALVIAAAWAFYVFVYQERIKPSFEQPAMEVSISVPHQPLNAGKELVSVVFSLKNIGPVPLQLDGILADVYGTRYTDRVATQTQNDASVTVTAHALAQAPRSLIATAIWRYKPWDGYSISSYAPGREKNPTFNFALKRDAYDALTVEYLFCYRRADDTFHISSFRPPKDRQGAYELLPLLSPHSVTGGERMCGYGISRAQAL